MAGSAFVFAGKDGSLYSRPASLDTPENRRALEPVRKRVAANIKAGNDPRPALVASLRGPDGHAHEPAAPAGPTVRSYYERWIIDKVPPEVRRAQAQDYRRHIRKYVLLTLGTLHLASLTARDILGLRSELRQRDLSLKFVKNILAGSFKAMLRDARNIDGLMPQDPFAGVTWPRVELPGPDPCTADKRHRILAWFRDKHSGFHPGPGTTGPRWRPPSALPRLRAPSVLDRDAP